MLTPYQTEKMKNIENFDELSQLRTTTKRTEEGKKLNQNKCVSSQNRRNRKGRGRYRSGVSPTFSLAKQCGLVS